MIESSYYLSVVVPMYNEQDNAQPLLEELWSVLSELKKPFEVIVVDDGSSDQTWHALNRAAKELGAPGTLRIVQLAENRGQSTAFWCGLSRVRGQFVVMMDGDMQNDPHDIPKLLEKLDNGADVCLTWRAERQDTKFKKIQSKIGNGFRNWLLKSKIRDTGSQLRAFRSECLTDLPHFNGMHRFMGNLFIAMGYKVVEVPTHHRARHAGVTKYGLGNRALRGLKDVLGVRWMTSRAIQYKVAREE
jgi:glycosyltransferase involved in cell wall biosynthesis